MLIIERSPFHSRVIFRGSDVYMIVHESGLKLWAVQLVDRNYQTSFDINGWFWKMMLETMVLHSMVAFAKCT